MPSSAAKSRSKAQPLRSPGARSLDAKGARAAGDRKPRAERWEEVLEAATQVFYEKGYDAASLQEIADRVGILKGSIYYYIKTKEDLRDHLLLEVHHKGLAMIQQLASSKGSALHRLEQMIRGHIDFVCRNLAQTTVYLHELKRIGPERRAALFPGHAYRDVFMAVIKQAQAEGLLLERLDPKLTAQVMLGTLNSPSVWYRPSRPRQSAAVADIFVLMVLRGLASDKGLRVLKPR